jgi:hypothetical protein
LLLPIISLALPSPGHQLTTPDGGDTQVGAGVGVGVNVVVAVAVAVAVGVNVAVAVGVNVAVAVGVNVAVAVGVNVAVAVGVNVAVGVGLTLDAALAKARKMGLFSPEAKVLRVPSGVNLLIELLPDSSDS